MLHDLLKIKRIRENTAREAVKLAKYKVEQGVKEVQAKKKKLADYIEWRQKEENNLYEEIMESFIKERELDLLKQKVVLMREKDSVLEDEITAAEKRLEENKKALSEAKAVLKKAMQTVQKFEEFTRIIDEEAAKEAERIEELEMEEFTNKKLN